ncbi:MAG: radical SAM protein [Candidatus Hydrogenedentota bacterium]
MKEIIIPQNYNYIAVFLFMGCNLKCDYCINYFEQGKFNRRYLNGREWVEGLNRIKSRQDLPLTLQGGEPSLHPDFIYIINNIRQDLNIDILTNLQFDIDRFIKEVKPQRIKRDAPYASIRVSYHPSQMELHNTINRVLKMQNAGFSIGIWGVMHPTNQETLLEAQKKCQRLGIDFRLKEFLGDYSGRTYGKYKYPDAVLKKIKKKVLCKTTELIIGSTGDIYRCHSDLYENRKPIGNILDPEFEIQDIYRECDFYGHCNPCDVKIKTNRFQIYGHTSVDIKFL